jgi:hypothetical protein
MSMRISILTMGIAALSAVTPLLAADDASFNKDLLATIALQGLPCDQLISSKRNGDSDYIAVCKNGNRYHVYVNPQGRVVVQKL